MMMMNTLPDEQTAKREGSASDANVFAATPGPLRPFRELFTSRVRDGVERGIAFRFQLYGHRIG